MSKTDSYDKQERDNDKNKEEEIVEESETASDSDDFDFTEVPDDELLKLSESAMREGAWCQAREALAELIERAKSKAVLAHQNVADFTPDLEPSLGKHYLCMGICCLKEMSEGDFLQQEIKEGEMSLPELAHICLEFARIIYSRRFRDEMGATKSERGETFEKVLANLSPGESDTNSVAAADVGLAQLFAKLAFELDNEPDERSTKEIELIADFISTATSSAQLEDHKGDHTVARDILISVLDTLVLGGIKGIFLRKIFYDLIYHLQCTNLQKSALAASILMQKTYEKVAKLSLSEAGRLGISEKELKDSAVVLQEVFIIIQKQYERMANTNEVTDRQDSQITSALKNALGDVKAEESGTTIGFSKASLQEQDVVEVAVRRKRSLVVDKHHNEHTKKAKKED